jgi:TonB family protein
MARFKSVPAAFLIALAIPTVCTAGQATEPQVAQTSEGACIAHPTPPSTLDRPDILSAPYVPPKPNPDAVTAPMLVSSVDPQFPSEALKGKEFSGVSLVALLVDTDGKPKQVHVEKSLGPDFDKSSVAAVRQYRFHPALRDGKPVAVKVCVEVDFRKY